MVILDDNTILEAFFVTNVISNPIFAPIAPVDTMEEIMVAGYPKTNHLGIIPIILPNQIQLKIQIRLDTLHQYPYGSTFVQLIRISSPDFFTGFQWHIIRILMINVSILEDTVLSDNVVLLRELWGGLISAHPYIQVFDDLSSYKGEEKF